MLVGVAGTDINPNFKDTPESWWSWLTEDVVGSQDGGLVAAAGRQLDRVTAIAEFRAAVSQLPQDLDSVKKFLERIGLNAKDWAALLEHMTLAIPLTGTTENKALWDKLDPLRDQAEKHQDALVRLSSFRDAALSLVAAIGDWVKKDPRNEERLDR